jgi:hypothetical protein
MQLGGWASYSMVLRYAYLAPYHLAAAAGKVVKPSRKKLAHWKTKTICERKCLILRRRAVPLFPPRPIADLKPMLERIDAGWQLKEFSSRTGVFSCTRGVERRQTEITPTDPGCPRTL